MDLILPKGTRLFHGTSEDFPADEIHGGGYDEVIWTAENPTIAQNYIPTCGGTSYIGARHISRPSKDLCAQAIQEIIGIYYDYFSVEWDYMDKAVRFHLPEGWDHLPETDEIAEMMAAVGFEHTDGSSSWDPLYAIRTKYMRDANGELYSHIFMPGEKLMGRLFIFDAQEPIKIYDYTYGGERESDLMNVDYHNIRLFRKVEAAGYDGIKINDFAQSKYWGNMSHTSIGLFQQALPKFIWTAIPATNFDWTDETRYETEMTPEYKEFIRVSS